MCSLTIVTIGCLHNKLSVCVCITVSGLPVMHSLRIFNVLEPKFTPFKFVLCVELTLWIGQWGLGQPSKILHYGLPLLRHRHHSCDLGKSAMLSARLYNPCFHHCEFLVLAIITLWEAVCLTLYCQNPNTTFKIIFWGLAALNTKRYPLCWRRGGENTPWNIKNGVKVPPWKTANREPCSLHIQFRKK